MQSIRVHMDTQEHTAHQGMQLRSARESHKYYPGILSKFEKFTLTKLHVIFHNILHY